MVLALIFTLFQSFTFNAHASLSPASQKNDFSNIEVQIEERKRVIKETADRIKNLEQNLVKTNDRLISTSEVRKKIDIDLGVAEAQLKASQEKIANLKAEISHRLRLAIVNSMGGQEDTSDLLAQRILIQSMKQQLVDLTHFNDENVKQLAQLKVEQQRLEEYSQLEGDLSQMLSELERQKSDLAKNYVVEKETLERMQREMATRKARASLKVQSRPKSSLEAHFSPPVDEFISLEYKKKGVTFSYSGRKPVLATQNGRILFTGSLSTYGNVVMIDHGNETRSVILGQFTPKVEKGMIVNASDVLGYTRDDTSGKGKIYFEVRQQNKVQDTFPLLDSTRLAGKTTSNQKL